ncbi:sulfotransferase family 2 domain-containing protein [Desulforhopalus singaporensis]|nr:sulfotransferase family 2 domain-containing protein [Desulforhopalus singaporensis]
MRTVILHYHLFKNAGTSLDATFRDNLGDQGWVTKEFPPQRPKNRAEVAVWLQENRTARCFSSHTAMMPPPLIEGLRVLPVIFVRHPLDRIASAYFFEKNQASDTFGAVLARNTSLAGYIETRLALPHDRQCRNFHVERFASFFDETEGGELERAKRALAALPFFGVVEKYDESLARLQAWLRQDGFGELELEAMKKNVSQRTSKKLCDKLNSLEEAVGKKLYAKLKEVNTPDLEFYSEARRIFGA